MKKVSLLRLRFKRFFALSFQKYFLKLFLSFLALVLLPVSLLMIILISVTGSRAKERFALGKQDFVRAIADNVQSRFDSIEKDLISLTISTPTLKSLNDETGAMQLYTILQNCTLLRDKNRIIDSVYYYNEVTGRIYTAGSGGQDFTDFSDTGWFDKINTPDGLKRLPWRFLKNSSSAQQSEPILTLIDRQKNEFTYVVNISYKMLLEELKSSYSLDLEQAVLYFTDTEGRVVTETSSTMTALPCSPAELLNNNQSIHNYNDRLYFGSGVFNGMLYCVLSYPGSQTDVLYNNVIKSYVLLLPLLLIFLLLVVLLVSNRLYRPIDALCEEISKNSSHRKQISTKATDELMMLKSTFHDMNRRQTDTTKLLNTYQSIVISSSLKMYVNRLIDYDTFETNCSTLLNNDPYLQLSLVSLYKQENGEQNSVLFRTNLQEVISAYLGLGGNGIVIEITDQTFLSLIVASDPVQLNLLQNKMMIAFRGLVENPLFLAAGAVITDAGLLPQQYTECSRLITYARFFDLTNMLITEFPSAQTNPSAVDELVNHKAQLIRSIVREEREECIALISSLRREILDRKSYEFAQTAYTELSETIQNEFSLTLSEQESELLTNSAIETLPNLEHSLIILCDRALERLALRSTEKDRFCEEARTYLEQHFAENIEIASVADALNISYPYLSKEFKRVYGISLSEYLNTYRIEIGKQLLSTTSYSTIEIAEQCGYNNIQSFQRFFRKYTSLTPVEYRRKSQAGLNE